MKRILSLLLCAAILFAVPMTLIPDVSAANEFKVITSFDADDVTGTKMINVFNSWNRKEEDRRANASSTYTRLSDYSAQMGPLGTGACQYFNICTFGDNGVSRAGYDYINYMIYADTPISIYSNLYDASGDSGHFGDSTSNSCCISLNVGWNIVTASMTRSVNTNKDSYAFGTNTTIKEITFGCATGHEIPAGHINAGEKYNAQTGLANAKLYVDTIFLSKNVPEKNDFTATNVTQGDSKVLTDIRGDKTIKFDAPGLKNNLNVNNVTVRYCKEGTHDEATHNPGTLTPGTDYSLGYEENTLKLIFANNLTPGTTYNIHIGGEGFVGDLGFRFKDYDLSFRTLGEGENIPPQATLTGLTENQRFFPSTDTITLTAEASDMNGTVEKVEFYAGETLLGEDTTGDAGVYSLVWENPTEDVNGVTITAKVYDDQGDFSVSEGVRILVLDKKNPEVTLIAPTSAVTISRNFSGIAADPGVTVSADVTCIGAEPSEVEFVLDGNTVYTATNVANSYSYTFTGLSLGEHSIYVRVTDTLDMQGITESIPVNVCDFAKIIPGVFEDDFESYDVDSVIDWTTVGENVSFTADVYANTSVGKLATENAAENETVYVQKRYRSALTSSPWEASVRLNFSDMNFERKVELSGLTEGLVLNFKTDGGVYSGSNKVADYRVGEWYDVKIVVDPAAKTMQALLDDAVVFTKTGLSATYSQDGATIRVSQNAVSGKSGSVLLDDAGIYRIGETTVEATGIELYDGASVVANMNSVPLTANKLTVTLNEAMGTSLKNNVWVIDTAENRKLSLKYDENAVYFNEELRGNREYKVVVTTGVSGVSGQAIAANGVYTFTTAPKDGEVTGVNFSETSLSDSVNSVTCSVPFINHSGTEHSLQVVAAVYDGKEMKKIVVQPATVAAATPSTTLTVVVPVDEYSPRTFIEVFVVEDLNTMVPVSEAIYQLK